MKTEEKVHAKYSASSASRWVACPGSIAMIERAPPAEDSEYAQEGTRAHTWLEKMLTNRNRLLAIAHECRKAESTEMAEFVLGSAQKILRMKTPETELLVEVKAKLNFIAPDMGGTTDVALVDLFGGLTIVDFKYGKGIAVEPERNLQMIAYALGVAHLNHYNFSHVNLVIMQPRIPHEKGAIRTWSTDVKTLYHYTRVFRDAYDQSRVKRPPLKSGDHCRFCPAKKICPEYGNLSLRRAQDDFADE